MFSFSQIEGLLLLCETVYNQEGNHYFSHANTEKNCMWLVVYFRVT